MINVYVGNLAYSVTEDDLRVKFEECGAVEKTSVIMDRLTGRSRGFGFVEMPNDDEAHRAIETMHDVELKGRKMLVREARPKSEMPRGERPPRREPRPD